MVLVEFCPYSCVNCRNVVPYLRAWHEQFAQAGVQDNAFAIWNSYAVRAWPTIVLIDKKGIIRYSPIGEGAYEQTQSMIIKLLAEAAGRQSFG